jgi:aminoacrylate hydrolase
LAAGPRGFAGDPRFAARAPSGARTESAAPAVLLSSGLGGLGQFWQPQLPMLEETHRVVLYDHRGMGKSPRTLPPGYDIAAMAEDALAVLDAAGIASAAVVGHALGGAIGLEMALRAPGRVGRLVVVNGWMKPDLHMRCCFAIRAEILRASGPAAYLRAQPIFLYPSTWIAVHHRELEAEEEAALAHFPPTETILARIAAILASDFTDRLHSLETPVLLVDNQDDMLVPPEQSDMLYLALPHAERASMPRGGHASSLTDPASFNALLRAYLATPS